MMPYIKEYAFKLFSNYKTTNERNKTKNKKKQDPYLHLLYFDTQRNVFCFVFFCLGL